jgi:hypothetical protein
LPSLSVNALPLTRASSPNIPFFETSKLQSFSLASASRLPMKELRSLDSNFSLAYLPRVLLECDRLDNSQTPLLVGRRGPRVHGQAGLLLPFSSLPLIPPICPTASRLATSTVTELQPDRRTASLLTCLAGFAVRAAAATTRLPLESIFGARLGGWMADCHCLGPSMPRIPETTRLFNSEFN